MNTVAKPQIVRPNWVRVIRQLEGQFCIYKKHQRSSAWLWIGHTRPNKKKNCAFVETKQGGFWVNTFINQVTELFCKTPPNIFCLQAAQCSYGSCSLQSLTRSHQPWRGYFTGNKEIGRQWTITQVGPFGGEPSLACNSLLPAALRRSLWRPPLLATGNWPGTSLDTLRLPSKICCHFELLQIIFIVRKDWIAKVIISSLSIKKNGSPRRSQETEGLRISSRWGKMSWLLTPSDM